METMKDRGNTAIPLNDVRSGKPNFAKDISYFARLQRVLCRQLLAGFGCFPAGGGQ